MIWLGLKEGWEWYASKKNSKGKRFVHYYVSRLTLEKDTRKGYPSKKLPKDFASKSTLTLHYLSSPC